MDDSFQDASYNALAAATATNGPSWPNPPWSTELLRGLLENDGFRRDFINNAADHLNATFVSSRLIGIIDEHADRYAPAIPTWYARWALTENWNAQVQSFRDFTVNRPAVMRQQYQSFFGLAGTGSVRVDVSDAARGSVRVNTLVIDANTPGLPVPGSPYPWTGAYFQGNAVTVTALPAAGSIFVRWQETGETTPTITVTPGAALVTRTAVFASDANPPQLAHYWHFNSLPAGTLTSVAADVAAVGAPTITWPGTGAGYLDNVAGSDVNAQLGNAAGLGLRVRNPSDTRELHITLPTTGLAEPLLAAAVWRSSNGAQEVRLEYATAAGTDNWLPLGGTVAISEVPGLVSWDFAGITAANDNPDFRVRLLFSGTNAAGASGNTRWDNVALYARLDSLSDVPDDNDLPRARPAPCRGPEPVQSADNAQLRVVAGRTGDARDLRPGRPPHADAGCRRPGGRECTRSSGTAATRTATPWPAAATWAACAPARATRWSRCSSCARLRRGTEAGGRGDAAAGRRKKGPSMRAFAKRLLTFLLLSFASTAAAQTVFINEYMSSNTATRVDVDGAYSDWIELYNPGRRDRRT